MIIAMSWIEFLFCPAIAVAFYIGHRVGFNYAMCDEKRALYWRRRARSAEGQVKKLRDSSPPPEPTNKVQQ